jgi:type VI secretion system protein ImpL
MRSLFTRRVLLIAIGFALFAWLIWWGWEYFQVSIGGYPPDSVGVRLIVIALAVGVWAAVLLLKRLRASRASARLMAAVARQADSGKGTPGPDALQLRERFDEAVAFLQQKRGRGSLYDLPWYIIIGAPGSGKTTALVNSGLHFPVEQRSGRAALRGVGGTRNCDWWFTDEAVFLDTAGRYTTQDSDAGSDSAGWAEFVSLLRKYRRRRPVNGVLVAMSAQDLMTQGPGAREEHVAAVRRRLDELNDQLGIQLPVYLLITKCDLVAGFTEYFDDLTQEERAQVWGVTFPYDRTRNRDAARQLPEEFDALIERLHERVFARVQEEGDPRRRAKAFGFPQQMAGLRTALTDFVADVFGSTRFDRTILLRGVYFTSGTQEGTPIDRLLGAIGRRFAVAPDAIAPAGRGKAYFIERLIKDVAIPESGLAGVNRRLELRKAAAQVGAYAGMAAVAVLGIIVLSISYSRNKGYIESVEAEVASLQATPPVPEGASMELMLPRLTAVQRVFEAANPHRDGVPWSMRWGLYQGRALGDDAREAYVDVLNGPLLSRVAARFRERFNDYASEPLLLYDYVKGYLMLAQPREHFDADHLRYLAELEWSVPSADESDTGPLMLGHFRNLLEQADGLRPVPIDPAMEVTLRGARSTIRQASIAHLAYLRLRRASERNVADALSLSEAAGLRAEEVLRRKDGVSLSAPILSLYTKEAFDEVTAPNAPESLIAQLADEQWVWGDEGMPKRSAGELAAELLAIYEKDYIAQWDAVTANIDVRSPATPGQAADALALLAGPTSPLRNLLRTIDEQTFLLRPEEAPQGGGLLSAAQDAAGKLVAPILGGRSGARTPADDVRRRITAHFDPIHRLVSAEGGDPPIERVLAQLGQLHEKVKSVGPDVGKSSPLDAASQVSINESTRQLRSTAAGLPAPVGAFVTQIAGRVESVVLRGVRGDLANQYRQAVVAECRSLVEGRYPLNPAASVEATPGDFGRVFGFGGIFDQFFESTLEPLVDVTQRPWRWRPTISNATIGSATMLRQFELARLVRDNFFRRGSQMLELTFRVRPVELDAAVRRFVLRVDGQAFEYQHGPERVVAMTWPGEGAPEAMVTFHDGSPVPPSRVFAGDWAFFRLLDAAQVQQETETRHVLTFQTNGYTSRVRVEADSSRNPFTSRHVLPQIRCEA